MKNKDSLRKKLLKAYNKALDDDARLSASLQILGSIASEYYGEDVVADICSGCEIEFRFSDDIYACSTMRIEDILFNKIQHNEQQKE